MHFKSRTLSICANIQIIFNIEPTDIKGGLFSASGIKEENFFQNRKIHSEVRVKKGTNAFITSNFDESEIILGRNQKFKILDILEEDDKIKIITETID